MKVALAQMNMSLDVQKNYGKTLQLIKIAASKGAKLICFPEIQLSPFFPQYQDSDVSNYVMTEDSNYVKGICEACKKYGIFASPNLYIEENGQKYDMSFLIDDQGKIIGRQKMVHVAECEQFYEQSYYTPSEEGFKVFDTKLGKIGIVVCFDRHYTESIRTEALRGAELIIIPTANTVNEPSELFRWEVRVQAFQNSVNIAMCNRVGSENHMTFSGDSIICNYEGDILALAGMDEELLIGDVEISSASVIRKSKPYTSLRRKDMYE
ncbi:MAG: carbon-nitrogen hydrolase family protein [Lachnospiraceae bacterium]|nr:carbon-nitrogen hydrolase family protein [Lachnospiraceae bacterium]